MRIQKPELALCMDYAAAMEACAAYVAIKDPPIREPEAVYRIVRPLLTAATGGDRQESFMVLLLNTKNRLIGIPRECTRGLLDSSPVHPREIFREAVRYSAASVILAHNHPSGDPSPSEADRALTRRIREASDLMQIRFLDHVIIGRRSGDGPPYFSFKEHGLL